MINYEHLTFFEYAWLCCLYDFLWLCITMYDYVSFMITNGSMSMYDNDYVWLCMTMHGYVWLCMTIYDYVLQEWLCVTMYNKVRLLMTNNLQAKQDRRYNKKRSTVCPWKHDAQLTLSLSTIYLNTD